MKINYIGRKFIGSVAINIHSHNTWEIIHIDKGTGILIADGMQYPFKKGTVLCIPPNTVHHNKLNTNNIHTTILTSDFLNLPEDKVVVFEDDSARSIHNLFNVIMAKFYSQDSATKEIIFRLADVLSMIMKEMIYDGYKFSDVEKVKNSMITNFADPTFTIGDALKNTNYSDAHFRKLFHEMIGMSPIKYLLELRLESAATQLRSRANSEMSIASIATESGFNEQSYFSRKFKEKFGVSPREYCKKDNSL